MCLLRAQVWNLTNCKLRASLVGHTGYINTVTVSPDGSLCASGGKARPSRSACMPCDRSGEASMTWSVPALLGWIGRGLARR